MKFFTVLLFASLAATSLAAVPGSKDELHLRTQPTDAIPASQFTPSSHISKESTSSKDLSKESSIFNEELVSEDSVGTESTKPQSPEAQDGLRSRSSQQEETTSAATSERKLTMLSQAVQKELGKVIGGFISGVEDIISGASGTVRP